MYPFIYIFILIGLSWGIRSIDAPSGDSILIVLPPKDLKLCNTNRDPLVYIFCSCGGVSVLVLHVPTIIHRI